MHPHLVRFTAPWGGEITIASYGFMIMVGFLICLYTLQRRAEKTDISRDAMFNVAIAMLLFGVFGARLFHIIQFWEEGGFAENPLRMLRVDRGGLVFYGGLAGGLAGAFIFILKQDLPFGKTLGLIASVGPIGHAFGRIGCFLNGCCYGRITTSFTGMRFPRILDSEQNIIGSPAFLDHLDAGLVQKTDLWSLPVHATQLYEAGYNLLIFALLTWWLSRHNRPSELIGLYMITYGMARFLNEIFRVTEPFAAGLSIAQIICIPLMIGGAAVLYYQKKVVQ